MMITPGELLDTSIAQLGALVAFLGDQLGDSSARPERAYTGSSRLQQILISLSVLSETSGHASPDT